MYGSKSYPAAKPGRPGSTKAGQSAPPPPSCAAGNCGGGAGSGKQK